jgi:hypothetical protein
MMTIEDNSDLRAAMNFTQNALNRVLHVFVITHDAPKQKPQPNAGDGTERGQKSNESFAQALKQISRNRRQSLEQDSMLVSAER